MTTNLRSLQGIVFAALLALTLWLSAIQAVADTRPFGLPDMFDRGFVDGGRYVPQQLGHLGVTWE
ncbi:MAG: hypothetical protein M3R54_08175 [Chloroflexota bacterium]|nr:hypothetical protein [Chloroflexota bacterium]